MLHPRVISSACLFLFFFVSYCMSNSADEQRTLPDEKKSSFKMYVSAEGGLRMREEASTDAQRILTIPDGSPVEVLEQKEEQITISGRNGRWAKVAFREPVTGLVQEGWVFGGFLTATSPLLTTFPSDIQGRWIDSDGTQLVITPEYAYIIMHSQYDGGDYNFCVAKSIARTANKFHVKCDRDADFDSVAPTDACCDPFSWAELDLRLTGSTLYRHEPQVCSSCEPAKDVPYNPM